MTTPGIFNLLITDDTEQDSYLIAQGKLTERLKSLKESKLKEYNDYISKLNDQILILKSQMIQTINTNVIINLQNQITEINKQIQFYEANKNDLIKPNINDINESHFLFIQNQYKPFVEFGFNYIKTTINSQASYGSEIEFTIQDNGDFISDMLIHIRIDKLIARTANDRVRYADFIGHKILKKCQFVISNNVIDEYDRELYNIYYNLHTPEGKKISWLKCMGQEIPFVGTLISDPVNDTHKEVRYISNGFQTLKQNHPRLELFIPLLFWFNRDYRLVFPNHLKPYGQLKVRIELEQSQQLMGSLDIINDVYNQNFDIPLIQSCTLYTKHIYMNPDIQDIFISKLGFNLIRIYKKVEKILLNNDDRISIQELKFPIESLYVLFRPTINETGIDNFQTWNLNSIANLTYVKTPVIYNVGGVDTLGINNIKYYNELPIVNAFRFEGNDSAIYGTQSVKFYDGYLPHISGQSIMSNNNNIYYLPFTFNPQQHQPCGYFNLSKIRELYLEYSSDVIETYKPVKVYIYATALNFLLLSQNAATLKYIT
jgi:hypothetical protein